MRKAVCYILALLIMLDTVALICTSSFLLTFGRESYYQSKIVTRNYVGACKKSISDGIADLGLASGIPKSVLQNAVTSSDIERDLKSAFSSYFAYIDGHASSISAPQDMSWLSQRLEKSIKSYAEKKGVSLSGNVKISVDSFIKKSINIYSNSLSQIPYFETVLKALRALLKIVRVAAAASAALLAVLSAACFAVSRGGAFRRLYYTLYGLICAGSLVSVCSAGVLMTGLQYKIVLFSEAVKKLVGDLITGIFTVTGWVGLLLVVFCVALILTNRILNGSQAFFNGQK